MAAGDVQVTVVGNLTDDPTLRFTSSGAAVASFTVASTPRTFDKDSNQFKDGADTLFLRCSVWRQYAENVAESLTRGMQVIVQGRLKQRSYEKDGEKRTVVELEVDEVGPCLKFATAKVVKAARGSNGGNGGSVQRSGGQQSGPSPQDDPWATSGGRGGYDDQPPF